MKLLKHFYFTILLGLLCNAGSAQINDTITTIYSGIIRSGYTPTFCGGGGCLYTLPVILPPGFTVTDVNYGFAYVTGGTCNQDQGGAIVSLDSCKAPCFTCTIGLPGFCEMNNISIFNDIKNCLPAAKCTKDTINFVLDFFRNTNIKAVCDSPSCITFDANYTWNITVIGQIDTCPTAVIEHQGYGSVFRIFPNPSTSQIILRSSFIYANEAVTVTITNAIGEMIQEEKRNWTDEISFNIKSLPPGVYFVQLQNEKGRYVERFVKE